MRILTKGFKLILNVFVTLILIVFIIAIFTPAANQDSNINKNINKFFNIMPFDVNNDDISYENNINKPTTLSTSRGEVISRAKAMAEVKWTPKYNLVDKKASYTFIKGKTYYGVPYSKDPYQINSSDNFLKKISSSKIIYGNDCSGFLSAVWGVSRQTTLSFYNAVKRNKKIDGNSVTEISWNDLMPGDAILMDDGKGDGHVMLYAETDSKDSDKIYVYEQNVATSVPYEPIPVARKDQRSIKNLKKIGYFPIRLETLK